MMKGCWQMVFQQQKEAKQLLDGVVSAMMEVRKKMTGWKEIKKNAERWCFSIGKADEGLLTNGVSATKRGETIAGRSCFGNDGGEKKMTGWKEMKNVERWCFSIGKTDERLLVIGVSATGGK
jgi:hypothetical protein